MKIRTDEIARVCWDGWALSYCIDVEDRVRPYGDPERLIARYFKLSGQGEFLFQTERDLSLFCVEKGIDLHRVFSSDFEAAVRVFHCHFRRGVMMERGGLSEQVASEQGASIDEGHYPAMEVEGVRWTVLKVRERRFIVEKVFLRLPALELDVVETQILKGRGGID
ncbi:hypothetical protein COCOR_05466 [Corallococcus coralloides DSM 2259]|uniref:Uncharacterized protein n=1 Tax=Corallococcus coralloides (strain ATCC 25202 / DSM 2259 / NBRC 100086 / M2) TaxID=1144275 RepID=H8MZ30_CORCM|nr:hypothetical protein [Corallococcus coralloides]AFE06385.1 hypothetical protein COCOR_05466 [Corallococcus coralloides DSM 2259]